MSILLCATQSWADQKAPGGDGEKGQATKSAAGVPTGKASVEDGKDTKPFIDRDGDGIRDGQEHRFRKRKHGQQDQEGEDDTGTGSGKRKRTMHGQTQSGGQGRQGR